MKMLLILIGLVFLVDVQGFGRGRNFYKWRPSFRKGDTSKKVYRIITETLTKASEGMNSSDLALAAARVSALADAHRKEVSDEEIRAIINEVASSFEGTKVVSALYDDSLNFEITKLESAFMLWRGLVRKGKELIAEGRPDDGVMGAISKTAKIIGTIIKNIDEMLPSIPQQTRDLDSRENDDLALQQVPNPKTL